jgi:hypothetical protein
MAHGTRGLRYCFPRCDHLTGSPETPDQVRPNEWDGMGDPCRFSCGRPPRPPFSRLPSTFPPILSEAGTDSARSVPRSPPIPGTGTGESVRAAARRTSTERTYLQMRPVPPGHGPPLPGSSPWPRATHSRETRTPGGVPIHLAHHLQHRVDPRSGHPITEEVRHGADEDQARPLYPKRFAQPLREQMRLGPLEAETAPVEPLEDPFRITVIAAVSAADHRVPGVVTEFDLRFVHAPASLCAIRVARVPCIPGSKPSTQTKTVSRS